MNRAARPIRPCTTDVQAKNISPVRAPPIRNRPTIKHRRTPNRAARPIRPDTTDVRAKNISPLPIQYLKQPYNICMQTALEPAQRRSIRLRGYDYAQAGAYFITICTHNRTHLFGTIAAGTVLTNAAGNAAADCWLQIPVHFPNVELDQWVVMPNHIHGILVITTPIEGAFVAEAHTAATAQAQANAAAHLTSPAKEKPQSPHRPRPSGTAGTIGSIVRGFKIGVTNWHRRQSIAAPIWQRNYWEHIVRDESQMQRIQNYIINNPAQWDSDSLREPRKEGTIAPINRAPGLEHEGWM